MRKIYYSCPFCNKVFKGEYYVSQLECANCGSKLQIHWLTNGKQWCGFVDTTLVCFWGATGSVDLPNNITKIGASVFEKCPKLAEVILPNSVQEIGENAFFFCFRLQNVELPNSLKIIRKKAFYFTGIRRLIIPKSVELIEEEAFESCSLIKEIIVHKDNPYFYVQNGSLVDKRTNKILATYCKSKVFYKITLGSNIEKEKAKEFNIIEFCEYDKKRIIQALKEVEYNQNKFIICEADTPINNITFLQALGDNNGLRIEVYLQKSSDDTIWEIWSCKCKYDKCLDYIISFLRGEFDPNFDEWELTINES